MKFFRNNDIIKLGKSVETVIAKAFIYPDFDSFNGFNDSVNDFFLFSLTIEDDYSSRKS